MSRNPYPKAIEVDLVLVFPPFQRRVVSMENVGIEYIAAAARASGFTVAMINAGLHGLGVPDIVKILSRSRFRVLGISTLHWTLSAGIEIARSARKSHPDCTIIFGGMEAAMDADRILPLYPFVDCIAMGEGEHTVPRLLSALAQGREWQDIEGLAFFNGKNVCRTRPARLIDPLDDLPFPDRDDMAAVVDAGGAVSISSSRGCTGHCTFCSIRPFYGLSVGQAWRGRSALSVVTEMKIIQERYGTTLFSFIDETVMGPGKMGRERLYEIAALIREFGIVCDFFMSLRADQVDQDLFGALQAAGLRKVEIGIESMAPSQLKRYGKIATTEDNRRAIRVLEAMGIAVELLMVPLDPGMVRAELETNLGFYQERFQKPGGYDVSPLCLGNYLYPYPGTGIRRVYAQNKWLTENHYARFRAKDRTMQKVGEVLILLVGAVEPDFPMSYLGLGNLWINSKGLPEPVYGRINRMCAEIGEQVVAVARWTLMIMDRPIPIPIEDMGMLITDLRGFLAAFARLRKELRVIVSRWADKGTTAPALAMENLFAEELHALGRRKKQEIIDAMQDQEPDAYEMITTILGIVMK